MFDVCGLIWFTCAVLIGLLFLGSVLRCFYSVDLRLVALVVLILFNSVEHCHVNLWFVLPLLGCFGLLVWCVVVSVD